VDGEGRVGSGGVTDHRARVEDDGHDLALLEARAAGALGGEQLAAVGDAAVVCGEADVSLKHHTPLLLVGAQVMAQPPCCTHGGRIHS
jgi:hypothetical protein